MTFGLTRAQRVLLDFIRSYMTETGAAPAYREMAAHLGIKSLSGVHRLVCGLEDRGHIRRIPGLQRAIELTEKPPAAKTPEAPRVRIVVDAMNRVKHYECEGAVNVTIVKEREVPGERG